MLVGAIWPSSAPEWLAQVIELANGVVDLIDMTVADLTRPDSPKA